MSTLLKRFALIEFTPLRYLIRVTWDNKIAPFIIGAVMFTTFGLYYAHSIVQVRSEESSRVIRREVVRRKKPEKKNDFARQRMAEVNRYDSLIHSHQLAY